MNPTTSTTIKTGMFGREDLDTCKGGDDQVALGVRSGGEAWLSHLLAI